MAKGDIILINFPFTDLSGTKLRPADILAETNLDFTVCFITSKVSWKEPTDLELHPNLSSGLKKISLLRTSKIATLDKSLAKGLLGKLSAVEAAELDSKLKTFFKLG